jgi:hypothetical protein
MAFAAKGGMTLQGSRVECNFLGQDVSTVLLKGENPMWKQFISIKCYYYTE